MAWNKRVMQFTKERRLELKTFKQKGPYPATSERATKLEKVVADFDVELDIDFEALFTVMGEKAALNRSGRCTDGFVTVRAKKKREISRTLEPIPVPPHYEEVTE